MTSYYEESGEGSAETADVAPLSDVGDGDGEDTTWQDDGPCTSGFSADTW